jgi:hypothetical protein
MQRCNVIHKISVKEGMVTDYIIMFFGVLGIARQFYGEAVRIMSRATSNFSS